MQSRLLKRKQEQNLVKARPSTRITIQVCGRRVSFCSNPFTYSYLLLAIIMIHLTSRFISSSNTHFLYTYLFSVNPAPIRRLHPNSSQEVHTTTKKTPKPNKLL
jgi:hypothetical protein